MGFMTYDLVLLAVFIVAVIIFLSTRKKGLERQGILYLYKTQFGVKFIDKFAKKFGGILRPLRYVVVASGYVLMIIVVWLIVKSVYIYLSSPLARAMFGKSPPLVLVVPYFPKLFGLESFFPPFYFTYFVIALAIVAVAHEFSHGIFARLHNFKIHSTGFAFLGPILGAFVEPDEKQMAKAKKFPQLSVLAAGTFANVLMALLFLLVLWGVFTAAFVPAGVKFDSYSLSEISMEDVFVVGNSSIEGYAEIEATPGKNIGDVSVLPSPPDGRARYFVESERLEEAIKQGASTLVVYDDSPAFRAQLRGAITEINWEKVVSRDELLNSLQAHRAGDTLMIKTAILEAGNGRVAETKEYEIVLGEREGEAFLGIGFFSDGGRGVLGFVYDKTFSKIKNPVIHYESVIGDIGWFVYYLLWWIVVINALVALFNMLPLGILDGGRFFYLTVWGLTGSEKAGRKLFALVTWLILALLAVMMVKWVIGFF